MFQRLYHIFTNYPIDLIAELVSFLPFIIGLLKYKYLTKGVRFLVGYFGIVLIRDFTSNIYAIRKVNNLFLYNASAYLEIVFFGLLFYFSYNKRSTKRILLFAAILTLFLCLFFWKTTELSAGVLTLSRAYALLIVLLYFNQLIQDLNVKNILKHSLFWISSGLIIQFTGTFFVYLFAGYVLSSRTQSAMFNLYWNVNQIMYIIFCLFSTTGLLFSKYDKRNAI